MTERTTLETLLARVLEGAGPDRELDRAIAMTLPPKARRGMYVRRHYTGSLDAALTLVPEGWGWTVFSPDLVLHTPSGAVLVDNTYLPPDDPFEYYRPVVDASGATPVRALIAACIKARMEVKP